MPSIYAYIVNYYVCFRFTVQYINMYVIKECPHSREVGKALNFHTARIYTSCAPGNIRQFDSGNLWLLPLLIFVAVIR